MTRSDRALYRSVFRDLAILAAKLLVFTISVGLLAFVAFHVMAL